MKIKEIDNKLYVIFKGQEPVEVHKDSIKEISEICSKLNPEVSEPDFKQGINAPELSYRIKIKFGCEDPDCDDSCGTVEAILLPEIKDYHPSCQTCLYSRNGERPCNRHLHEIKPDYSKGVECAYNNFIHYKPFKDYI